jgi:CHAT domain-containing protein
MTDDELEALTSEVYRSGSSAGLGRLRSAIASHSTDTHSARSLAVAGSAQLVAYKLGQQVSDLQVALDRFEDAVALEPTAARLANLAACLLELNDVPEEEIAKNRSERHARAVELLRTALADSEPDSRQWVSRCTTYVGALIDAVVLDLPSADVAVMVDTARQLAAVAGQLGVGEGEPENLLGNALQTVVDLGVPGYELAEAIDALTSSVAATPIHHIDRPARLSNLGSALMDHYERTGDTEALTRSRQAHELAMAGFEQDDSRLPTAANNAANTLIALYKHTGDPQFLRESEELLPILVGRFSVHDHRYPAVLSNAGLIQFEVAQRSRDVADAAAAIELHRRSIEATVDAGQLSHPMLAGRLQSMANALMLHYELTGDPTNLDAAIELGERAISAGTGADHERAIFLSSQGTAYHERFLRTGRIADLELSARLQLVALAGMPERSPFRPSLLNNAAVSLADRYERLADPQDLLAAIDALQRALSTHQEETPERAARMTNLALNRLRLFESTGDEAELAAAEELARAALSTAQATGAQVAASSALATMSDLLAVRAETFGDPAAATQLGALWNAATPTAARASAEPAGLLRRALLTAKFADLGDRRRLLTEAARLGLDRRPAVTLSAARQLALDGLVDQVAGRDCGETVEFAARLGGEGLAALVRRDDELRHALSWRSEVRGIAAALAHSRALRGEVAEAIAAHEAGHAVLLSARATSSDHVELGTVVTVWSTPVGGAAVIAREAEPPALVLLPAADSSTVAGWSRTLGKAARIGRSALTNALIRIRKHLTDAITAPIAVHLTAGEPVLWVSAGPMAVLPIDAALTADNSVLGARHPMRHAPTSAVAAATSARAAGLTLDGDWVSVGAPSPSRYPALPAAAAEMSAFAYPGRRHTGIDATVERAAAAITSAALGHFACHARTTAVDPLMNHLILAGDQPWFADDIARLACANRLTILSACDTAAPGTAHADEALGLAGSILAAGGAGVIASLWSVADIETGRLMTDLARQLRDGLEPAAALTRARNVSREAGEVAWAAFHLLGS